MWRSFFFALGITLIMVGAQCLFVEQFQIADSTRVPGFVAKFMDSKSNSKPSDPAKSSFYGGGALGNRATGIQNPSNQMPISASGSRFGPSRFESQFGSSTYPQNSFYGGQPSGVQRSNQPFSLAGFGNSNRATPPSPVQQQGPSTNVFGDEVKIKVFRSKDWMPWSLLAAGTLVVLYTNGTQRRFSSE